MARPTRKSRSRRRASRTKKTSSMSPNKSSKKLFSLLLMVLEVVLWILLLVVSYVFPAAEDLAKSLRRLIQLLLAHLDDEYLRVLLVFSSLTGDRSDKGAYSCYS